MVDKEFIEKYVSKGYGFIALTDTFEPQYIQAEKIRYNLNKYEQDYIKSLPEELHFKFIHQFRHMSSKILMQVVLLEHQLTNLHN
jgi:hypothetical protein